MFFVSGKALDITVAQGCFTNVHASWCTSIKVECLAHIQELHALPGIGAYTASAVLTFAYQMPERYWLTNIRSVFIHHFFSDDTDVSDADTHLLSRTNA